MDVASGEREGHGTMYFLTGDRYVGRWRRGKMHGKGRMMYANGDEYAGEFVDNSPNGEDGKDLS